MIILKNRDEIRLMREAGRIVARVHEAMREMIRPGVTTAELDAQAEAIIRSHQAVPAFLGYPHTGRNDYPASICASINEELVHGIPSSQRWLEPGDIISIDVGAVFQGWVGDSAWTYAVGQIDEESQRLLKVTEESLWAGVPRQGRVTIWLTYLRPSRPGSGPTGSAWYTSIRDMGSAGTCMSRRRS